jgi:hypothetical protein
MRQRTRLDHDHPCLACGAPWAITEQTIEVAEQQGGSNDWRQVSGDCSARCVQTGRSTVEAANAALEARRARGW